jgi:UDP-N-acetylmuramoylalanine--D-glutamate ligase
MLQDVLTYAQAPLMGIAGTSGKSTTAALVQAMLRASGHRVSANVETAYVRLGRFTPRDRIVLELPWQLAVQAEDLSILAITGLGCDELDADTTMDAVTRALQPAVETVRDALVVNGDDAHCLALATATRSEVLHVAVNDRSAAATVIDGTVFVRCDGASRPVCGLGETALGVGGLVTDLLVASAVAFRSGASVADIRRTALGYAPRNGQHEVLGVRGGVTWVNDAAATRPGRTAATLAGYSAPVLLVAGGEYGGQPLWRWAQVVAKRAARVLIFDTGASDLAEALRGVGGLERIIRCADLEDAMAVVRRIAAPGDTVLLSPGCSPGVESNPAARFRSLVGPSDRTRVAA